MPQCEPLNTYLMSHVVLVASKNMKFRLFQTLTKFDAVTRLHENIPTVKSVSSFEIYKKFQIFGRNYHFTLFQKIKIFSGFTVRGLGRQARENFPLPSPRSLLHHHLKAQPLAVLMSCPLALLSEGLPSTMAPFQEILTAVTRICPTSIFMTFQHSPTFPSLETPCGLCSNTPWSLS